MSTTLAPPSPPTLTPLTIHGGHGALEADDISKGSSDHAGLNDGSHDYVHVVHESTSVTVPDLDKWNIRETKQTVDIALRSTHN